MGFTLTLALTGFSVQSKANGCVEVRTKSIKPCSHFEKQGLFRTWPYSPPPMVINGNLYYIDMDYDLLFWFSFY